MKIPPQTFSNALRISFAIAIVFASVSAGLLPSSTVDAAQITNRSLTLEANGTHGGSLPGTTPADKSNHLFNFNLPTSANIQSVKFEYCTTAANSPAVPSCVPPTDLDTTGATFANVSGPTFTAVTSSSANSAYITRASGAPVSGAVSVRLIGVRNPSVANQTFFARITSYTSNNATTGLTDSGTVAASTSNAIILTGTMPESLVFCTGQQVLTTLGVPDCATATSGAIDFNQLFSPTTTALAVSQMAASTNAGSGYAITVNGPTLTSGSNTITALATTANSIKGVSQFGLNLKANTSAAAAGFPGTTAPYISADIATPSNGTNLRAQPKAGYDTADSFTFNNGATVADSGQSNASPVASDAQIYTASYIVNVPGSQPAGTYTTTLTYICTATF